ncbi:thioredoxin domain-containing protein [Pendulispora brunnea]|uniref:Thioredoxin domain-containing protein n=1 Tax=Pendulispora brunnea TaxID=2905690 RepID=A0ABZ2KCS3_9BACT
MFVARPSSAVERFLFGCFIVCTLVCAGCKARAPDSKTGAAGAGASSEARTWVPLDETPLRGPATAALTLVVFCDYESPYCARAFEHLRGLRREYGDALRIQYRHNPLPIYEHSQSAAEAVAAAAEQGKFWAYHDRLTEHREALDRASLDRYATELGLDMNRFREALESERARKKVDGDSILAAQLQVRGAPVFFVNGRGIRGLRDYATYKRIFDEEWAAADALLKSGTEPAALYRRIAHDGSGPVDAGPVKEEPVPADNTPPPLDPNIVYKVETGDSPAKGPANAKVTIVLWSDFECARCGAFEKELDAALAPYERDVRVVWKFRPIPDHPAAMLAAETALAAGREGKFWEMHDLLFLGPVEGRAKLEGYAKKLNLDGARFREALDDRPYSESVAKDLALSEDLVIRNLPTFFINGKRMAEATVDAIRARVREELKGAARPYESIIAQGQEGLGLRAAELPPLPKGHYPVDVGTSPMRGPKDAPVTIVTFSDFQCPYCAKLEKTLDKVRAHYGDKVRIVWKDAPGTDIHPDAMGAHVAARAAGEQGRFWEMHDAIFSRPYVLGRAMLERHAERLGLDMDRFRRDMDSGKFEAAIREETEYGVSLAGPSGTPTVFVNGRLMPGAFPFETFRQVIDEALR